MQPELTQDKVYSVSWWGGILAVLFAVLGTNIIVGVFIGIPSMIYTEFITMQEPTALHVSVGDTAFRFGRLIVLLLFIYAYDPIKSLVIPTFNFHVLKKINMYIYVLLFLAASWIIYLYVLEPLFPHAGEEQYVALKSEMLDQYPILLFLSSTILAPIVEEITYRGIILRLFQERFSFWIAAIGSSFLFSIAHSYSVGVMIDTFIGGMFMAILCKKTNSIIPAILLHILNNALG
ncbi:CPBP family intramembrane glutamic endopeptidase [Bacillus mycoides]|uniref:CPBP family intramembrane glutamic endopeptidase n=1 Tax=Bacillus mycoides TaxID=1405 RepID=UPI000B4A88A9|nr:CPBP family intramembrane glutamic endopeptidase [Bacillus mycoides]